MSAESVGIVVAIDGPAGSGKSTTAKAVAARLGYRHLDSGAFYRAITLAAMEAGLPEERWGDLKTRDLEKLEVTSRPGESGFVMQIGGKDVDEQIRSPAVNQRVSRMAAVPAVREWLLDSLRAAGETGGLVADGRDIGTVVFPDAELKVFLVCDQRERARRRLIDHGVERPDPDQIREEALRLGERDRQDESRPTAPLVQAADAVRLDSTELDFDAQVRTIADLARAAQPA